MRRRKFQQPPRQGQGHDHPDDDFHDHPHDDFYDRPHDLADLRSDSQGIVFTNPSVTTANTTNINRTAIVTNPAADSIGIHAGLSDFTGFNEFHVILYDRVGSIRRTFHIELRVANRAEVVNPVEGTFYPLDGTTSSRITYTERPDSGGQTSWLSYTGTATITNVTDTSYTVTLLPTEMRLTSTSTDAFDITGSVVVQKSQIGNEADSLYHSHQNGVAASTGRTQEGTSFH